MHPAIPRLSFVSFVALAAFSPPCPAGDPAPTVRPHVLDLYAYLRGACRRRFAARKA